MWYCSSCSLFGTVSSSSSLCVVLSKVPLFPGCGTVSSSGSVGAVSSFCSLGVLLYFCFLCMYLLVIPFVCGTVRSSRIRDIWICNMVRWFGGVVFSGRAMACVMVLRAMPTLSCNFTDSQEAPPTCIVQPCLLSGASVPRRGSVVYLTDLCRCLKVGVACLVVLCEFMCVLC